MKSSEVVPVRMTRKEKEVYQKLARFKDMTLSALIRKVLGDMARRNGIRGEK